ncbi:MAG TPA: class I SAM-dependent methyltransferase [Terriglobales bacterium]|nr:class I SAM-dependent methyltransferase [Terriglobales bacterium]
MAPAAICLPPQKDRSGFLRVLRAHIRSGKLATVGNVLAVGASNEDAAVLRAAGFDHITLSNFGGGIEWERMAVVAAEYPTLRLDAEQMELPDGSFDVVFAHEMIHHCRSPHRAVCEMLRVSRRYVVFMEPNDCLLMRLLTRLKLSYPFEIAVVIDQGYATGGVRNSNIPNFIFRWDAHEVWKTVSAFLPEESVRVHAYPYWELNASERDLDLRKGTRLKLVAACLGGMRNFVRLLHLGPALLNTLPFVRRQGNKFFCVLEKTGELREWLLREPDTGNIVFNRQY